MKFGGRNRSENVGISNEKTSENLVRRKPKVSWGRLVRPGLVGPKARPKGVVDGNQVTLNIPEPPTLKPGPPLPRSYNLIDLIIRSKRWQEKARRMLR